MRAVIPTLVLLLGAFSCNASGSDAGLRWNVVLPTFGGLQMWSDTFWCEGWRIQEHAWTGHSRLLDPDNRRRAYGTRDACKRRFDDRHRGDVQVEMDSGSLVPSAAAADACPTATRVASSDLVVLVHGLGRTRGAMAALDRALQEAGHRTARVSYASTRAPIEKHADGLEALLLDLPEGARVDFVTHSLGGLVAMDVLTRAEPWSRLERGRLVQLAPPNGGSVLAQLASSSRAARTVLGPSLGDIAWRGVEPEDAGELEVGVIAAGRGTRGGWNPLIPGDDDGVVGVDEARLPGARDELVIAGLHTFLMDDGAVHAAVVEFLRSGSFESQQGSALEDE